MQTIRRWNAIYTRSNCEQKVSRLLAKKGITYYCPQNQVLVDGFDHKKMITEALFPSIIFVQVPEYISLSSLVLLPNVINLVYWKSQPADLPAAEIDLLRRFLEAHESVQTLKTGLKIIPEANAQELAGPQYSSKDKIYTIHLPSLGYTLSAKSEPVTSIKLVRKNTSGYRVTDSLAFILGLKSASNKFE